MNHFEETKAQELIKEYMDQISSKNINARRIDIILSELEEISMNGKEFLNLIEKPLKENYVPRKDYTKQSEALENLKLREYNH